MTRRLVFAIALSTAVWLVPARFGVAAEDRSPQALAQAQGQSQRMADMMKMHEQMMAEMRGADVKLETLVKEMNAGRGDAKVTAMAAVVNELVTQHEAMHERMGQMHQQMMGGLGMMMPK